ncbi:class I SAM-dependent methyltransferase [Pseudonocardia sediminis]|uniref:class I SAM-dependent methyltransferase n=1 Tax=Pseudonocardia sediminis TaxID=1397368 RepID=UPI001F5F3883|nr:class I SAM-dependent methyltransferase [Pseudonocardia sediminis]
MTDAVDAAAAIRHHYDVGNAFYALWLDDSLSYSCAMPSGPSDTLGAAQERKLAFHLDAVGAGDAESILDVGCGWGAVLARASARGVSRSVGLTLSDEQADLVGDLGCPGVEVRRESWTDHDPAARYDGVVSVGAFEHFASPADPPEEKIRIYRRFFARCHGWLAGGGTLSLQTIAYANMDRAHASGFMQQEIFRDADLPTLAEITAAADGLFEIRSVRNDRLDYAWTCEQWAGRLRARRGEAVDLVGPDVVARYERYLRMSALGFRMGKICLLRIVATPQRDAFFGSPGTTSSAR